MVEFVVDAILFFDFAVVIVMIQFAITESVFVLFFLGLFQNFGKCISEIYDTNLSSFGWSDLCGVPCSVVSDAPAYCEILLIQVDVLPGKTRNFSDAKSCEVCYLNR